MKAFIEAISYYLPERTLNNNELVQQHPEWNVEKIALKTGIQTRHIAANDEFASDMAVKAAKKLFLEYNINPDEIDFLLYCTQSPDYFIPTTACILQSKLNLPVKCGALDFNLGCSGFIYGLSIAKGLIFSNIAKKVLLITSETYSKYIHDKDKSNKTIFGDASAATLISKDSKGFEILDFALGTDGNGAENLIVKNGGIRHKNDKGSDIYGENNVFHHNNDFLYMNGGAIFKFTSDKIPTVVDEILEKNNLQKSDIDYFVFHQANKYILDNIRKKADIIEEKFIYYIENVGNTVSNTIPIALKEECFNKRYGKFLLTGYGVGYSWGGCVLNYSNVKII